MNNNPTITPQVVNSPFTNFCMSIGAIPTSYKDSLDYYETLLWLIKFLDETVIPAVTTNGNAVAELQEFYLQLQSYVNNYFDNLDVQDEINNKLDDMVEQGTLQEIIADYLNSKAVFGYDNVESMKNSTNLIDGSYAQTLGYYEANDGGSATYRVRTITNDDVVDDMFIIALSNNTLVAELIIENSYINTNQAGLKANDSSFDNSTKFTSLISKCNSKGLNIEFNKGIYYFSNPISLDYRLQAMNIKGQGLPFTNSNNGTTLRYTGSGWFIDLNKCWKCTFKDFQIESAENGIKMSDIFFQSHLENVHFLNCKNAILLKQFAYAYLTNIQVNTNNSNSEYALKVGETTTDKTEYLFVNGFINEDDDIHSSNDGIFITRGIHLNFQNMDFVEKNNAIKIEPIELTRYVFFNNVDIARSHIGFNLNATLSFSNVYIENCMMGFRETNSADDRLLVYNKASGKAITDLITKNFGGVALGTNPDYMVEALTTYILSHCKLSIDYNPSNIPSKILLTDNEETQLECYYEGLKQTNRIFLNDANLKTITLTLLSNSPFSATPWVNIQANKPVIKSYTISNTNGGDLTATITLVDDFTTGTIIFFSDIPSAPYHQRSINAQ